MSAYANDPRVTLDRDVCVAHAPDGRYWSIHLEGGWWVARPVGSQGGTMFDRLDDALNKLIGGPR